MTTKAALLQLSATKLAALVRTREVRSIEVVDAHIERILRVNPMLNAVVCDRFDEARAEARAADARTSKTDALPALHGVPCTIKECFALEGMPQTSGLVSRRGFHPTEDATAVARLRKAGAIPLGVTNVSELCMWMEASNAVYGRTNNPYDRRRTCGGSSGGEGAIVGAGGSPFGLGSDIGGSVRMPAFFCGVFGHKPTGGLVPGTGQYPIASGPALRYLATGPLARKAEDLWPLLEVLRGPDGKDPGTRSFDLGDPGAVDLAGVRLLSVEDNGALDVSMELRAAQARASAALQARGARLVPWKSDALRHSVQIWSALMTAAGGPTFASLLGDGTDVSTVRELGLWLRGRSDHTLPAIGLVILESLAKHAPAAQQLRFEKLAHSLGTEMRDVLGPNGILLYPSYTRTAPLHHTALLPPIQWMYTAIFNALEMPATQVPLGLDTRGLPLGVQVAALPGNDHLTIAAALALEEDFGGWVSPPALAAVHARH
jgi:fatty acid amide hydrolase 2